MFQPSDTDLDGQLASELKMVAQLEARVAECDQASKGDPVAFAAKLEELRKQQVPFFLKHIFKHLIIICIQQTDTHIRILQTFFKSHWRKAKQRVDEFIASIAEHKGLKKSGVTDLLEKIGIESDAAV